MDQVEKKEIMSVSNTASSKPIVLNILAGLLICFFLRYSSQFLYFHYIIVFSFSVSCFFPRIVFFSLLLHFFFRVFNLPILQFLPLYH